MAVVPSTMLPLGTVAPNFALTDVSSGQLVTLQSGQPTVIMFMCNHCPYVQHVLPKLLEIIPAYQSRGIKFIAINSNDIKSYPEDAPDKMKHLAQTKQFSFPYVFDETQEVAMQYQAACTPDFYIFDKNLKCIYRGRFDASTPSNGEPLTGQDLCQALDSLLANKPIPEDQHPSMGCSIKWVE